MSKMMAATFNDNDVRMGTVLSSPDNVRCYVDGRSCDLVQLSVLDNLTIDGQHELTMSLHELHDKQWRIARLAA